MLDSDYDNRPGRILIDQVRAGKIKVYRNGSLLSPDDYKILYDRANGYSIVKITNPASLSGTFTGYFVLAIIVDMEITGYLKQTESVTYKAGINRFCGSCHTDYDTSKVDGSGHSLSGVYSNKIRHKVGNLVTSAIPGLKFEQPASGQYRLVCLTCHVAHGTSQDYWQRTLIDTLSLPEWDASMLAEISGSSRLKRMPNMGTCEACHEKGPASYATH